MGGPDGAIEGTARAARPLVGARVLVPRGGAWGERAAAQLRERGASPVVTDLIRFAPPADPAPLADAIAGLVEGRVDWVVVTSPRAARALLDGLCGRACPARIAAVGEATSRALAPLVPDLVPDLVPGAGASAAALVAQWPQGHGPGTRVLWPRSAIAAPTIRDGLRALGATVDDPVAYETHAVDPPAEVRAALADGGIDLALVTSGSIARALAALRPHPATTIATIGPATTREARAAGLRVDIEAAERSVPGLLDAIEAVRPPMSGAAGPAPIPITTESTPAPGSTAARDAQTPTAPEES